MGKAEEREAYLRVGDGERENWRLACGRRVRDGGLAL